jgi:hypothetical protein
MFVYFPPSSDFRFRLTSTRHVGAAGAVHLNSLHSLKHSVSGPGHGLHGFLHGMSGSLHGLHRSGHGVSGFKHSVSGSGHGLHGSLHGVSGSGHGLPGSGLGLKNFGHSLRFCGQTPSFQSFIAVKKVIHREWVGQPLSDRLCENHGH